LNLKKTGIQDSIASPSSPVPKKVAIVVQLRISAAGIQFTCFLVDEEYLMLDQWK